MTSFDERSYMTDTMTRDTKNVQIVYQAKSLTNPTQDKEKRPPCISISDIKSLRTEVIMFIYMFSYLVRNVTSTTLIMDKVCLVHLNFSQHVCANLSAHPEQKVTVETLSNNYNVGLLMLQLLPASILACFVGAWSDRYGRKLPIIVALCGVIVDGFISIACAYYLYTPVVYFLLSAVFSGFSGGVISVLTVLYSYAADTTSVERRTMKYTMMEMAFGLAIPIGQLTGGWMYASCGYVPVFLTSTAGFFLSLVWVVFALPETKGLHSSDDWRTKFWRLWSVEPVVECFRATIKWRPNKGRKQIVLLILSMGIVVLGSSSTINISYMYAHHLYNWDNATYSTVSAIFCVAGTAALLIVVPFFKLLNLGDPTLGIAGTISLFLKNLGIGLASKPQVYFFANFAGILTGLATLAGRSRISKVASEEDIGKVFAFVTTAESLVPIMSIVLVSQVFNATVNIFPGLVYVVLAVPMIIPLGVFIWLACLPSNCEESEDEAHIHNDGEPDSHSIN